MHPYLADNKLRKDEKLLNRAQFDAVFDGGKSSGNKLLVVHWLANTLGHPRLGIVVSTRFGNAVRRNQFKRRVREMFRLHKAQSGSRDIVVLPAKKPPAKPATYEELLEAYLKLLGKAG